MTIIRSTHRYKRPRGRKKPVAIEGPAVLRRYPQRDPQHLIAYSRAGG